MLKTREEWLTLAVTLLAPLFDEQSYKVPANIRVACGFPSVNPFGSKKQRIGECWASTASKDDHFEVFISPVLADEPRVLGVLVHEIVHAVVGLAAGHKKPFKDCAVAVGLEGKMTATTEGVELVERLHALAPRLGKYPHAEMSKMTTLRKTQTTRMLKIVCPGCGWTARTAQKHIDAGLPTCACGEEIKVEE